MKEEKCCGNCCWFYAEDTYGCGACPFDFAEVKECERTCDQNSFMSKKQMRHFIAVLLQHNRWRRYDGVPNECRMVDPNELGKAIDFACKYIKTFSSL